MLISTALCLFLAVLLTLSPVYGFFISTPSKGDMRPYDPTVEEGDTLVLNCTLTEHYNGTYNAGSIIFKGAHRNYTNLPFVRTLSERTAQLQLPNVTQDMDSVFSCSLPDTRFLGHYALQKVHVARRPLKPYIVDCIVLNWESMECYWKPDRSVQVDHTLSPGSFQQNLFWSRNGSAWMKCPMTTDKENRLQTETCVWPSSEFEMGGVYCVQVNATNILKKNISSEIVCYDAERIVQPNPPSDIRYKFEDGEVAISWQPPLSDDKYSASLLYDVSIYSQWGQEIVFHEISETTCRFHAIPFTNYVMNLSAKAAYTSQTFLKSFLTQPTAPCRNPVATKNSFSVSSSSEKRKIIFYWQRITEQDTCGPNLIYHLRTKRKSADNWIDTNANTTNDNIELEFDTDAYDVVIVSGNSVGPSKENLNENEIICVPPSTIDISYDVVVEGSGALVSVHWFELEETANDVVGYTLFWCKSYSRLHTCKDKIRWKEFSGTQNEYNLTLDESYDLFQVGLAVNLIDGSSGIKWSTCMYSLTASDADPPANVKAAVPNGSPGHLHVSWTLPTETCDKDCGYVRSLTIYYCSISSQTLCRDVTHSVTVPSYVTSYELSKLEQGSTYKIWMSSHTRTGVSRLTEPILASTSAAWATTGVIAGIVIGIVFAAVIVAGAIYIMVRYCYKISHNIKICYPPVAQNQHIANPDCHAGAIPYDCGQTVSYNDYYIRQTSQASRFSTVSGDSGNFSLNPSSPTMLPLLSRDTEAAGIVGTTTPLLKFVDNDAAFPGAFVSYSNYTRSVHDDAERPRHGDADFVSSHETAFDDPDRSKMKPEMPDNSIIANHGYYVRPDEMEQIQSGAFQDNSRLPPETTKSARGGKEPRNGDVVVFGNKQDFLLPDIGYTKAEYFKPFRGNNNDNDALLSLNAENETPFRQQANTISDEVIMAERQPTIVLQDVSNAVKSDADEGSSFDGMVVHDDDPFDGDGYVQHGLLLNAGVAL